MLFTRRAKGKIEEDLGIRVDDKFEFSGGLIVIIHISVIRRLDHVVLVHQITSRSTQNNVLC